MKKVKTSLLWSTVAAFLLVAGAAWGQQADARPVSDQGVARLSVIDGSVSTQRGDAGDWEAGALNAPLVSGDNVATGDGGHAEVQLDYADWLRLGPNAQVTLASLGTDRMQIQVGTGTVELVSRTGGAAVELDSPNMALVPSGPGRYRLEAISDSETHAVVREGAAQVNTPQGSTDVKAGELIEVQGTDEPQYQIAAAPPVDDFDRWSQARDRMIAEAQSWRYTNPYYTGVEDLDAYGRWVMVPGYGQVWQPAQSPDWAPYRAGRWVWEPDFGWTWVSSEPWGWAPYHYGRWFVYDSAWVWWPGPVTPIYRPMWAPAYVSFVGLNVGPVAVGVGFGSIGWVPIGPSDAFMPWWGRRPMTTVAVVDLNSYHDGILVAPLMPVRPGLVVYSNIGTVGVNLRVREGVTVVEADRFGRGPVVVAARVRLTPEQFRAGTVIGGTLPVVPGRESLRVSDRVVAPPPFAARVAVRHYYSVRPAPPARRNFNEEVTRVQANIHGQAAPVNRAAPERPAAPAARGGQWQRFGGGNAPAGQAAPPANRGNANSRPLGAADHTAPTPERAQPRPATTPSGGATPQRDGNWHSFTPKPGDKKPPASDDKKGRGGDGGR